MRPWKRGDFVECDGLLAVVVAVEEDPQVPEGHVALWFGQPQGRRRSEGGSGGLRPEVWTVPAECCVESSPATVQH
jgi:hypothetical protein